MPISTANTDQDHATPSPIGIVLAGGQSSRMGTDKASLLLDHESLLLRARRKLLASGCAPIYLSGNPRDNWPDATISDEVVSAGPVAGIIACIKALQPAHDAQQVLLFIPVDAPLLDPVLLKNLAESARAADAAIYHDHPLPLAIRLSQSVMERISSQEIHLNEEKSCSINGFLKSLNTCILVSDANDERSFININTPADWNSLEEGSAHSSGSLQ